MFFIKSEPRWNVGLLLNIVLNLPFNSIAILSKTLSSLQLLISFAVKHLDNDLSVSQKLSCAFNWTSVGSGAVIPFSQ